MAVGTESDRSAMDSGEGQGVAVVGREGKLWG